MPVKGDASSAVPLDPAWLVECWIISSDDKIVESDTELQAFAEQLVPYVRNAYSRRLIFIFSRLVELVKPRQAKPAAAPARPPMMGVLKPGV